MNNSLSEPKQRLRQAALFSRSKLSRAERAKQSAQITDQLATLPVFNAATTVASYESWVSEPQTGAINQALLARGARVLVPAGGISPGWRALTDHPRHGSTTNPDYPLPPQAIAEADLIIVPALAVDATGTRLGRGAGWYDQMLALAKPQAIIVALLFDGEFQNTEQLPKATHDLPVHYAITPRAARNVVN